SFPMAACSHTSPKVTVTPTGTVWSAAGASVNYTVSVTNNDTCACAASAFDVGAAGPARREAPTQHNPPGRPRSPTTAAVHGPGAPTPASIGGGVPAGTAGGFYNLALTAANASAPAASGAAVSTIALASSLNVTASSNASFNRPKNKNQTVNAAITTTVTSGG